MLVVVGVVGGGYLVCYDLVCYVVVADKGCNFLLYRKRLQLKDSQAFYLLINNRMIGNSSQLLADVYKTQKDEDGFLYITYASQEMFG